MVYLHLWIRSRDQTCYPVVTVRSSRTAISTFVHIEGFNYMMLPIMTPVVMAKMRYCSLRLPGIVVKKKGHFVGFEATVMATERAVLKPWITTIQKRHGGIIRYLPTAQLHIVDELTSRGVNIDRCNVTIEGIAVRIPPDLIKIIDHFNSINEIVLVNLDGSCNNIVFEVCWLGHLESCCE